jgi:hypothetical protein
VVSGRWRGLLLPQRAISGIMAVNGLHSPAGLFWTVNYCCLSSRASSSLLSFFRFLACAASSFLSASNLLLASRSAGTLVSSCPPPALAHHFPIVPLCPGFRRQQNSWLPRSPSAHCPSKCHTRALQELKDRRKVKDCVFPVTVRVRR